MGETGDILDLRLREGQVHTADGGLEFVLEVLERAERHLCGKAAVRFDAGYPGEPLMAALEERGTHYVARVRNNAVLKRLALPAMDAVVWEALLAGRPYEGDEPRIWVCEAAEPYRAGSWSRTRRVVQVLVEEPGELFPRSFWLLTSLSAGQVTGEELLAMYRQRGKAEGRPKRHYRGQPVEKPGPGVDAFACNETRLLLAVFGYQIMHAQRAVLERATGTGWSLRRLLERVLRAPARFTVSGRRIAMIASAASRHWHLLVRQLQLLPGPAGQLSTTGAELKGAKAWHPCARNRDPLPPIGGSKPEKPCRTESWRPILGSGDPVFRPGGPDRPESSPAVGLGE